MSLAGWLPVNKGLLFKPMAGTIETLTPFFGVGWLSIFRRCSIHVTLNIQKKDTEYRCYPVILEHSIVVPSLDCTKAKVLKKPCDIGGAIRVAGDDVFFY